MHDALIIRLAIEADHQYADSISDMYRESSKQRGTGIAIRQPDYIRQKISEGKAMIAFIEQKLAGFCYIETFSKGTYVSNSGLIVSTRYRGMGLGRSIKAEIFKMAQEKYPAAKVFGITTSSVVMKINSDLGYVPVSFQQLTDDEEFWKGCNSCPNYDILLRNDKKLCLCTGMLANSKNEQIKKKKSQEAIKEENQSNE